MNNKFLRIKDDFADHLRGYDELEKTTRDAMQLSLETIQYKGLIFPPLSRPASPGYVTYHSEYFEISHSNQTLKRNLSDIFLEDHYFGHSSIYSSSAKDLAHFFEFVFYELLVYGFATYAIDWQQKEINGRQYIIPNFYYQFPSSLRIRKQKGKLKSVGRNISFWTYLANKKNGPRKITFIRNEIFYLEYPFAKKSPVLASLRELPNIKKYFDYMVNQAKGMAQPENHSLEVEITRHVLHIFPKRLHDIARGKIRKNFNYLYDDARLTDYYDTFVVARYKKFLNNFRDYLVDQFNKQVLKEFALRNNIKNAPILKIKDDIFISNEMITDVLEKFQDGEYSVEDFINKVIKRD